MFLSEKIMFFLQQTCDVNLFLNIFPLAIYPGN